MLKLCLSAASAIASLSFIGFQPAAARPADVFLPHLNHIQQNLAPGHVMRLPAQVRLGGPVALQPEELIVKVYPSQTPEVMTVSLLTCDFGAFPCLVGSFSSMRADSSIAQTELARHQGQGTPITLASGIQGFLLEGARLTPALDFSSVMWQQDGMIYTVSFLNHERQNILNMASSMANDSPIRRSMPIE